MQAFQAVLLTLVVLVVGIGLFLLFVVKPVFERAANDLTDQKVEDGPSPETDEK